MESEAVFLRFGFVSAQLQGFANLLLRRSLAKAQKSSLRIGCNLFSNARIPGFCAIGVVRNFFHTHYGIWLSPSQARVRLTPPSTKTKNKIKSQ
jgi:hypothetical protein